MTRLGTIVWSLGLPLMFLSWAPPGISFVVACAQSPSAYQVTNKALTEDVASQKLMIDRALQILGGDHISRMQIGEINIYQTDMTSGKTKESELVDPYDDKSSAAKTSILGQVHATPSARNVGRITWNLTVNPALSLLLLKSSSDFLLRDRHAEPHVPGNCAVFREKINGSTSYIWCFDNTGMPSSCTASIAGIGFSKLGSVTKFSYSDFRGYQGGLLPYAIDLGRSKGKASEKLRLNSIVSAKGNVQ